MRDSDQPITDLDCQLLVGIAIAVLRPLDQGSIWHTPLPNAPASRPNAAAYLYRGRERRNSSIFRPLSWPSSSRLVQTVMAAT